MQLVCHCTVVAPADTRTHSFVNTHIYPAVGRALLMCQRTITVPVVCRIMREVGYTQPAPLLSIFFQPVNTVHLRNVPHRLTCPPPPPSSSFYVRRTGWKVLRRSLGGLNTEEGSSMKDPPAPGGAKEQVRLLGTEHPIHAFLPVFLPFFPLRFPPHLLPTFSPPSPHLVVRPCTRQRCSNIP